MSNCRFFVFLTSSPSPPETLPRLYKNQSELSRSPLLELLIREVVLLDIVLPAGESAAVELRLVKVEQLVKFVALARFERNLVHTCGLEPVFFRQP